MDVVTSSLLFDNPGILYYLVKRSKRRRKPVSAMYKMREQFGEFHHLFPQLRKDVAAFFAYARMTMSTFNYIVESIEGEFKQVVTNFQRPIEIQERLMLTIRFVTTGISYRQLALSFRISKSTVSAIVKEVCLAVWKTMAAIHMPKPSVGSFEKNARHYFRKWGFPHVLGSMDGKHIPVKCPPNSGSMFHNTKHLYSLVFMAVADADYKFVMVDVRAYENDSDGSIFANTKFIKDIESKKIVLPKERQLPNSTQKAPYVFLCDEAFPLRTYLMRPFPSKQVLDDPEKRQFNFNLSKSKMTVDCTFDIMTSTFHVLHRPVETSIENAVRIVKAITLFHNIIIDREGAPAEEIEEFRKNNVSQGTSNLWNFQPSRRNNRSTASALRVRKIFCEYFKLRDSVDFQQTA